MEVSLNDPTIICPFKVADDKVDENGQLLPAPVQPSNDDKNLTQHRFTIEMCLDQEQIENLENKLSSFLSSYERGLEKLSQDNLSPEELKEKKEDLLQDLIKNIKSCCKIFMWKHQLESPQQEIPEDIVKIFSFRNNFFKNPFLDPSFLSWLDKI